MAKCNRDYFNCIHDDCVVSLTDISREERKDIKERDKRYFDEMDARTIIKQRPVRAKSRNSRKVYA